MSERKYRGSCHCGAVTFEVEADISTVMECNCSHCAKKGFLLAFTPAEKFNLLSGDGGLTDYRFNKKRVSHQFCNVCGVQSFTGGAMPDGTEVKGVNVRCLDGVDLSKSAVTKIDGKSM